MRKREPDDVDLRIAKPLVLIAEHCTRDASVTAERKPSGGDRGDADEPARGPRQILDEAVRVRREEADLLSDQPLDLVIELVAHEQTANLPREGHKLVLVHLEPVLHN